MPSPQRPFRESNLYGSPIRDLKLAIADTRLAPVIDEFRAELRARGLTKITPTFYLSTEWGVSFGTVAVGIPFYLARPELTELHDEEVGHIEGFNHADILRYLRHEMGHVLNYAYKLYDDESWVKVFGSITQPYREDYRPQPFSRRFVRHLPGWYAQKHPDEDWAETFAVWMTPTADWRADYAQWPSALAKLELCDRLVATFAVREPLVTSTEREDDVAALDYSLREFYKSLPAEPEPGAAGLDGDLRAIFDDLIEYGEGVAAQETRPAGELIRRLERQLMADVFRWTGHFPEKTRSLMRDLAKRADALRQVYPRAAEAQAIVGVTTLVTSLAMNFVHRGAYFPETAAAAGASQTPAVPGGGAGAASASGAGAGGGAGSSAARGGVAGGGTAGADPDDKGE
jgi:putative zinc-binding metallo-peptidase